MTNSIETTFGKMRVGSHGRVLSIGKGDSLYRQRLIAMGLIPGTEFIISRIAPLGDPIEIQVRGFALTLRKAEANILKIAEVSE